MNGAEREALRQAVATQRARQLRDEAQARLLVRRAAEHEAWERRLLRRHRQLLRQPAGGQRPRSTYRHCCYCGARTNRLALACTEHNDLVALDPHYGGGSMRRYHTQAVRGATA